MRKLKSKIEYCLQKYQDTRNSDIKLTSAIWIEFYGQYISKDSKGRLIVALIDLYKIPREDNVKRIRAKIQNEEGKYLPTSEEVLKQRGLNEYKWRKELGYEVYDNPALG